MVNGKEFSVFPDIESGKEKIPEKINTDKEYFAFGSDDLNGRKKSDDKTFEDKIKSGKDMVMKFGSFLGNSFKEIVKPKGSKDDIKTDGKETVAATKDNRQQKTDEPPVVRGPPGEIADSKTEQNKRNEALTELKNISSKIGATFLNFGVGLLVKNNQNGSGNKGLHEIKSS